MTIPTGGGASALAAVDEGVWFTAVASSGGATWRHAPHRLPSEVPSPSRHRSAQQLIWSFMGDGLVGYPRRSGSGGTQLIPALAESIPSDTDGGLTFGFRLRPGSCTRMVSRCWPKISATPSSAATRSRTRLGATADLPLFGALRGAEACTDPPVPRCDLSPGIVTDAAAGTITFHLTEPDPDFLSSLAEAIRCRRVPHHPMRSPKSRSRARAPTWLPRPATPSGGWSGIHTSSRGARSTVRTASSTRSCSSRPKPGRRRRSWSSAARPTGSSHSLTRR